jgi:predicted nuclease with RNAse H fold
LVDAVVGIDVGGACKGFHAVALTAGTYAGQLATGDASDLAHWCRSVMHARVIAIDAPVAGAAMAARALANRS